MSNKTITGRVNTADFSFDLLKIHSSNYCAALGMWREEIPNRSTSISQLEKYSGRLNRHATILLNTHFNTTPSEFNLTIKALLNTTGGKDYGEILWEYGETPYDSIFVCLIGQVIVMELGEVMISSGLDTGSFVVIPKGKKLNLGIDGGTAILVLEKRPYIDEM